MAEAGSRSAVEEVVATVWVSVVVVVPVAFGAKYAVADAEEVGDGLEMAVVACWAVEAVEEGMPAAWMTVCCPASSLAASAGVALLEGVHMEEDMLHLVEAVQVRPVVVASVLLLAGCRMVDSVCMHSSAAVWDLAAAVAA